MLLENQLALVTGASRGIGKAIARELGEKGAFVIGTATSEQGTDRITKEFKQNNIEGTAIILDVSDNKSVESMADYFSNEGIKPSILVNNAGITQDNLMMRMSNDEWERVINTNLNSVFKVTRVCLRNMIKARHGRIINISSVVGYAGNPGQSNYSAAKAGMIGFTKSLAREVGSRGITVNSIAPGFIQTDMTEQLDDKQREALLQQIPLQRLGTPEEIATVVSFLVSDSARYITGQTIHVNGGMYMG